MATCPDCGQEYDEQGKHICPHEVVTGTNSSDTVKFTTAEGDFDITETKP